MAAASRGVLASSTSLPSPDAAGRSAAVARASQRTLFSTSPLAIREPTSPAAAALMSTVQVRRFPSDEDVLENASQVVPAETTAAMSTLRRNPHEATLN